MSTLGRNAVRFILRRNDAFAVVATHSPVVVQETLSRHVSIVRRSGDETRIFRPRIQTYGESIGEITNEVFGLTADATDVHASLSKLVDAGIPLEAIGGLFEGGLSMQARAFADVPSHQKAKARDRVMTFDEIGRMLDLCIDRPDREHLVRFIVLALGTAGRPEALLEVAQKDVNLADDLIDTSGGKAHPRKRRPIVPIAKHVRPWIEGLEGKLIRYRIPIAEKNRVPGGPTQFERETRSIKNVWNAVCHDAGIEGATPKTLRHTMLTWLANRGVPAEQRQMLAGHSPQGATARNYELLSPDYLQAAIREVDALFGELAKHTKVPLRYTCDTPHSDQLAA